MRIESHSFYKKTSQNKVKYKTIIKSSNVPWDDYYRLVETLYNRDYTDLITNTVECPKDCLFSTHLSLVNGLISSTEWLENNSIYKWKFVKMKPIKASIGNGNLPGVIGMWEKEGKI